MRAVVQRVSRADVVIDGVRTAAIGPGLCVFLGVCPQDTEKDRDYMITKLVNLRIFEDENEKMNRSALDVGAEILLVSQFTLYGDCRKGRRPSFIGAGSPAEAEKIYDAFAAELSKQPLTVKTGEFQADMQVSLTNDGPVTLLLDSSKLF